MKAISIRQPYAHDIMCGLKTIEYRTWQTKYRGDLLICASQLPKVKNTISGHALCIVNLKDCAKITLDNYKEYGVDRADVDGKLYAWLLDDVRIIKPVPVKGKLNFFEVDDSLLEIIDNDDDSMTQEQADELYFKYIEPLLYKG